MNIFAKFGMLFGLLACGTGIIGIIIGLINPDTLSDLNGFENQLSMAMNGFENHLSMAIKYFKMVSFTFC